MSRKRHEYRVGGENGYWRFRRRWAAERAFERIELGPEQPCVLLYRVDLDGVLSLLRERQFRDNRGGE